MLELCKNIYQFPVVLPDSPLKELNCFVIKGADRSLMIDTGFCIDESKKAVMKGLSELSIDLNKLDVFLTHFHADHAGLIDVMKNDNNVIYMSKEDFEELSNELREDYWVYVVKKCKLIGFPPGRELNYNEHPAYINRAKKATACTFLKEGDEISYGGYAFTVLDLRGHTMGQLGLYEKEHGFLFSGDHVLNKITPNINAWDFETDYLGNFIKNLKKVKALKINKLFSAHRALLDAPYGRIDELLLHHENRLNNIREYLRKKPSSAYECSSLLKWDFMGGYFPDFPDTQKWFASSEMLAHLQHLLFTGEADRTLTEDGVYLYSLK